jgi:cyclic pyranopterin phosphate synthase
MTEDRANQLARVDYLRLSVTDRCNLRCTYCMPPEGVCPRSHEEILSYEELAAFAEVAVAVGITKVRLTGGEPLVRKGLPEFVAMLAAIPGITDLSLTTNGLLLPRLAAPLRRAGLRRVNISIDSLRAERYAQITRGGRLEDALAGLRVAFAEGFSPVKLNVVLLQGIEDELDEFVRLTVRDASRSLELAEGPYGHGPATYWRAKGARGTLGFIAGVSDHFCSSCNRLRLTADGRLKTCLFGGDEIDVRPLIGRPNELAATLRRALQHKTFDKRAERLANRRAMSQIGG